MKPKFSFTNQKVLNQINNEVNYNSKNNVNNDKEKENDNYIQSTLTYNVVILRL